MKVTWRFMLKHEKKMTLVVKEKTVRYQSYSERGAACQNLELCHIFAILQNRQTD